MAEGTASKQIFIAVHLGEKLALGKNVQKIELTAQEGNFVAFESAARSPTTSRARVISRYNWVLIMAVVDYWKRGASRTQGSSGFLFVLRHVCLELVTWRNVSHEIA